MKDFLLTDNEIALIIEKRNTIVGENDYVVKGDNAELILRDVKGKEKQRTIVSTNKIDILKNINWFASGNNYVCGRVNNEIYTIHRYLLNAKPNELVDHIDHNKFNNTMENLRICSRSENMMNSIIPSNNKSGFKGVNKDKRYNKWRAYITVNKQQINLGYFDNLSDAIKARQDANQKYQGEFAYANAKEVVLA